MPSCRCSLGTPHMSCARVSAPSRRTEEETRSGISWPAGYGAEPDGPRRFAERVRRHRSTSGRWGKAPACGAPGHFARECGTKGGNTGWQGAKTGRAPRRKEGGKGIPMERLRRLRLVRARTGWVSGSKVTINRAEVGAAASQSVRPFLRTHAVDQDPPVEQEAQAVGGIWNVEFAQCLSGDHDSILDRKPFAPLARPDASGPGLTVPARPVHVLAGAAREDGGSGTLRAQGSLRASRRCAWNAEPSRLDSSCLSWACRGECGEGGGRPGGAQKGPPFRGPLWRRPGQSPPRGLACRFVWRGPRRSHSGCREACGGGLRRRGVP